MHSSAPEWRTSSGLIPYEEALVQMEARVEAVAAGRERELLWLLEHPPLYTGGTSAKAEHLLLPHFPVYETGRGGQYTYHGPGQRVVYTVLNLKARAAPDVPDVRRFVYTLEQWIIDTLATFGVTGERREGRIGIWVRTSSKPVCNLADASAKTQDFENRSAATIEGREQRKRKNPRLQQAAVEITNRFSGEAKIAALGIRIRRGVSLHGIAINVHPDLSHFAGIVPCGIQDYGVTSLHALGHAVSMQEVDAALRQHCPF